MPQSLARVVLHVVFSTKNRVPFLKDTGVRIRLFAYMAGVLQNIGCAPILINGVEDHVFTFFATSPAPSASRHSLEEAKKSPSKWMKEQGAAFSDFLLARWIRLPSLLANLMSSNVRAYVAAQEEHHRKVSFQDGEFRALCQKHGIAIDERYVWD